MKCDRIQAGYGAREQPSWGYKLQLTWKAPERAITSLRLAGSMKIVTGAPRSFTVDQLGKQQNRTLESPLLKPAGLKMIENPWPRSSGMTFLGAREQPTAYFLTFDGPAAHVYAVELIDAKQQLITQFSGRSYVGSSWHDKNSNTRGEGGTFLFEFYPPLPENPKLRITVLEQAHEVIVPLELSDIAIPKNRPTLELKQPEKAK